MLERVEQAVTKREQAFEMGLRGQKNLKPVN